LNDTTVDPFGFHFSQVDFFAPFDLADEAQCSD